MHVRRSRSLGNKFATPSVVQVSSLEWMRLKLEVDATDRVMQT